jgi:hypothetical protein
MAERCGVVKCRIIWLTLIALFWRYLQPAATLRRAHTTASDRLRRVVPNNSRRSK